MSGAAAARGDGEDEVLSNTGTRSNCARPMITATDKCSEDVFANGIGIVREDDQVKEHPKRGCSVDTLILNENLSSSVFINGKKAGRIGSQYNGGDERNTITEGSKSVFVAY